MKKTLLAFGVFLAVVCCTLAYAANGQGRWMNVAAAAQSNDTSDAPAVGVGVSIGTVDAQLYSESGLNLDYFGGATYVAKTSEGTYMGFKETNDYMYDDETGEEVPVSYISFCAVSSTEESVTIPDSIRIDGQANPIITLYGGNNMRRSFTSNIKNLTLPATIKSLENPDRFDRYLDAIYVLGEAPEVYGSFENTRIYVCDKSHLGSFFNNEYYAAAGIFPYGWDYEWITVNVEKGGEFAETYLTQNDFDWGAAQYVKVTGNINDTDLSAIKNLTSLMKLDLSETAITTLPARFMYGRSSLQEVKLPATLQGIGTEAFRGCAALQSFDLNGITAIGDYVFYGCRSLPYINLNGVEIIGRAAFYGCSKLDNVDLSTLVSISDGINAGDGAFQNCTSLETVIFGTRLKKVGIAAFNTTAIKIVDLPEGINSLGGYAFYHCTNLTSVSLPSTLTSINDGTFSECAALTSVTMHSGITSIGDRAFDGCSALEEISIPATVRSIGHGAFSDTGIKTFKCYAAVPPTANYSFIGGDMDLSRTYLYVPPFSKDFYRNTQYWSDFYLMRSIDEQVDYILVDRPLTINLEEEDNDVVANNPRIDLSYGKEDDGYYDYYVGQLTATGEGTLSAGQLNIDARLSSRRGGSGGQYCPTLINYADKMRADNVTVNMSFSFSSNEGTGWHFISLPFDVKVSDIVPTDNTYWVIRRYDSASRAAGETAATWVNLTEDDTMEAGKGYIISAAGGEVMEENSYYYQAGFKFTSGNSLTKNNLFRPTDIIVPLTEYPAEFAHNRSWNLIGNPYPCYFDMHYLNEEFTAPVTVWNGSAYVAYSPVDDDLVLSPYEAFFVQCPLDAAEMTFKEAGRLHADEGTSRYKSQAKNRPAVSAEERNVFNFEIKGADYSDRARVVMNPEAAMGYEIGRDASKFFADNSGAAQLYVAGDVNYSICERPVSDGAATLGIRSGLEEEYTLSLSGRYSAEWHVIVTDKVTGESVDLTEGDYRFTTSKADDSDRFSVKFRLGEQSGLDSAISAFGADARVTVTAVNGVSVYEGPVSGISVPAAGLYIISDGTETRKAILK